MKGGLLCLFAWLLYVVIFGPINLGTALYFTIIGGICYAVESED